MTLAQMIALNGQFTRLMVESQTVVALRMMGMAGVLSAHADENDRMVAEKLPALVKSAEAATRAAWQGQRPDQVMNAAIKPLSRKVRANRRRLMK